MTHYLQTGDISLELQNVVGFIQAKIPQIWKTLVQAWRRMIHFHLPQWFGNGSRVWTVWLTGLLLFFVVLEASHLEPDIPPLKGKTIVAHSAGTPDLAKTPETQLASIDCSASSGLHRTSAPQPCINPGGRSSH